MKTKNMITIALFAALTSILSLMPAIPIPFSPVPITLQVLGVFLTGSILGAKKGALAMALYLVLGAFGLPVFAGGQGGFSVLLGPTGGYLLGFPIAAFICGFFVERSEIRQRKKTTAFVLSALLGIAAIYILGTIQLANVLQIPIDKAFLIGSLPYIPLDVLKMVMAFTVAHPVRNRLKASRLISE